MKSNVAASVRQRILHQARQRGEDNQGLLTRYAIERLLYRLSQSSHRERFVLKGAVLYLVWLEESAELRYRPTRDLDFWGSGSPTVEGVVAAFREILQTPVEPDGLEWLVDEIRGQTMREDADYEGCRLVLAARLDGAKIPLQIDFGFGDAITPAPGEVNYPTLLTDFAAPRLRAYPRETVIAEKFQALVVLEMANSRLKDFFDLWALSQSFEFEGRALRAAFLATFARRKTVIPADLPVALTPQFTRDAAKIAAWRAFGRRSRLADLPELESVAAHIAEFVWPVAEKARDGDSFEARWDRTKWGEVR